MANKEDLSTTPGTGDVGHSFDKEDTILNYKPTIEYEEPLQEETDRPSTPQTNELEDLRNRTKDLISGYKAVQELVAIAKQKVDAKAADMEVALDPVADAAASNALKRCFPDAPDHTKITYEQYKACLTRMAKAGAMTPQVSAAEIEAAKANPLQTDFGGLGNQRGENRPEVSSPAGNVKPVDLKAFQIAGVLALFKMMWPLIKREDKLEIIQHKLDTKHVTP
jgi:hypothetical protein